MNTTYRAPVALALAAAMVTLAGCRGRDPAPAARDGDAAPAKPKLVRTAAAGEWLVDVEKSKLTLSIVRDHDTASPIVGTVMLRDGRIALDGPTPSAKLSFDLSTFDSGIPMRNERVQKFFFESTVSGWETAELVVAQIPDAAVASLRAKRRATHVPIEGELKLHAHKVKVTATVDAFYAPSGALSVTTSGPFEVKVSDFSLTDNLRRLSSICLHESIDDVVKGELSLDFPAL